MDGMSERGVIHEIKSFSQDKTLILVTHKPATLELVDRLIVLDNGRLHADGPKAEVLRILAAQKTNDGSQKKKPTMVKQNIRVSPTKKTAGTAKEIFDGLKDKVAQGALS